MRRAAARTERHALLMAMVGFGLPALAGVVPPAGLVDARVRELEYREGQVVQLVAYLGYHIHIELESGERFVSLGAGDAAGLDIAAEGQHVMLKPKAERVATNLTLVSSRRVYHFEYRTYEAQPPPGSAIFALRFRYRSAEVTPAATLGLSPSSAPLPFSSREPAISVPSAAVTAGPAAGDTEPTRPLNTNYWYCGSRWLKPAAVTDDGVQTRLTFASQGEWPAIFVRNQDGSEALVNFHAEGTTAVVHRVAPRFVLRRGALVGCVENRGYTGSGAWLPRGTQVPGQARQTTE